LYEKQYVTKDVPLELEEHEVSAAMCLKLLASDVTKLVKTFIE